MTDHVPFDRDWWAIGFIEPEFVTEITGWANKEILIKEGFLELMSFGHAEAIAYLPPRIPTTERPLPEPIPIEETHLRWRWVAPIDRRQLVGVW